MKCDGRKARANKECAKEMRVIQISRPGGLETLIPTVVPEPLPGPSEVRIAISFAGLNWGDIQKRLGIYPDPISYPAVIGLEVSGHLDAIGCTVTGWHLGQRVAAITGPQMLGGYAEKCVVPAEYLIALPDAIDLQRGAAFPATTLTAYHLLNTASQADAADRILVHAIGGALGLVVTQMAVAKGATVFGTAGSVSKAERALEFGARRVFVRNHEDFVTGIAEETAGSGVDLVIDSLGGDVLERSFDALRPFGRVINIGEASGDPDFDIRAKLYERSTSLAGFEFLHAGPGSPRWRHGLDEILAMLASGQLDVPIEGVFPMHEVRKAHARLESRAVRGKLLLSMANDHHISS